MRVPLGLTALILMFAGFAAEARDQDDYGEALAEARARFSVLYTQAQEADDTASPYPAALLRDIANFYQDGSQNDRVLRNYCREQVLRLYRRMLYLSPDAHDPGADAEALIDNARRLNRYLEPDGAALLRQNVTEFLRTSFDDLSIRQRKLLYILAGKVLTPEDAEALRILDDLYHRNDAAPDERLVIDAVIGEIQYQTPAAPALTTPDPPTRRH